MPIKWKTATSKHSWYKMIKIYIYIYIHTHTVWTALHPKEKKSLVLKGIWKPEKPLAVSDPLFSKRRVVKMKYIKTSLSLPHKHWSLSTLLSSKFWSHFCLQSLTIGVIFNHTNFRDRACLLQRAVIEFMMVCTCWLLGFNQRMSTSVNGSYFRKSLNRCWLGLGGVKKW